ncbi:MAG: hypothetical protein WC593_07420 [Methanoregula sp.]
MKIIFRFGTPEHVTAEEMSMDYGTGGYPLGKWNRDARFQRRDARFGKICPAHACGSCTADDCFYADFIRNHWKHPHGD